MSDQKNSKYSVPALEKSVTILDFLAQNKEGFSLSELSNQLAMPKTSVFTILNTLESHNYVRKSPEGLYHLGLKLYNLGMTAINHIDIKRVFVPYMEQLRDNTHFTVHMCMYDNGETICMEKIDGPGMISFKSFVGERKKMNTTSVGKAIAAYLPEKELQIMFSKGLQILTPNSISTENALRAHLQQVRAFGYAVDDEEGEIGVRCIGVPIFIDEGNIFGAISLSTLKSNLPMQKLQEYGEKLMTVANAVSKQLGYKGPYPKIEIK
jgi:DNA-binding IclR family transcriptional regulator